MARDNHEVGFFLVTVFECPFQKFHPCGKLRFARLISGDKASREGWLLGVEGRKE